MKIRDFNELNFRSQLELLHKSATELGNVFPWYGNLRIISIYSLYDFFVELECDLTNKEFTRIYTFRSFKYLEKYPHHFDKIKNKVYSILNQ